MDDLSGSTPPASPMETIDPVEVQRSFIEARQNAIERLGEEIREEQERTKICVQTIAELEAAITEDRGSLKGLEEKLINLLAEQEKSKTSERRQNRGSRLKVIGRRNQNAARMLDEQIKEAEKEIEEIGSEIFECKKELEKWRHLRMLSTAAINYLKTTKGKEEFSLQMAHPEEISSIVVGQRDRIPSNIGSRPASKPNLPKPEVARPEAPKPRVPRQILAKIFKFVLDAEYQAYNHNPSEKPLRPLVYVLGHVCRQWRSITWDTAALWNIVYASPNQTEYMKELLTLASLKARGRITVTINLSQSTFISNSDDIFRGTPHTAHVTVIDSDMNHLKSLLRLQFPTADSLIISSLNGFYSDHPSPNVKGGFKSITSLTISTEFRGEPPDRNISNLFPCLITLTLQFEEFSTGSFPYWWYLASNLQALYIHSGWGSRMAPLLSKTFYQLHTLGICSNGMAFLHNVSMRQLKRLVLYCPKYPKWRAAILPTWTSIEHLEFDGWDSRNSPPYRTIIQKVAVQEKRLKSVKFINCFLEHTILMGICRNRTTVHSDGSISEISEKTWTDTLILSHTTGITRKQCQAVQQYVGELEVYA